MGVYISGLEIPPKGKGAVVILCSSGSVYSGGQKVGTAVPVPPHGRLIDADALKNKEIIFNHDDWDDVFDDGLLFVLEQVDNAPTIIPAEEGE